MITLSPLPILQYLAPSSKLKTDNLSLIFFFLEETKETMAPP